MKNTLFPPKRERHKFVLPENNTETTKQKRTNQNIQNHDSNYILEQRIRSKSYHHIDVQVIVVILAIITTKNDEHYWQS